MTLKRKVLLPAIGVALAMALVVEPDPVAWLSGAPAPETAEARVGRPGTVVSYAGVARRTTRRVVRRSTIHVATLPASCVTVSVNGATIYQCGATYYQPYNTRYVVVYVD